MVILHLPPEHDSQPVALLQPSTAMPVVGVTKAVPIECGQMYSIPPGRALVLADGVLHCSWPGPGLPPALSRHRN